MPSPPQLSDLLRLCIARNLPLPAKSIHAFIIKSTLLSLDTFLSNRLVEFYTQSKNYAYALRTFNCTPQPNLFSWNSILTSLSKSSNLDDALKLFDRMPTRNDISWNIIIGLLARSGRERKALDVFSTMISEGFMPTSFTIASVLSACRGLAAVGDGQRCHGLSLKIGLSQNLFVENALIGMYTKCGHDEDALKLFGSMTNPNEVSFTAMMGGLASSGSVDKAYRLFARMHGGGIQIDPVAVSSMLGACARLQEHEMNEKLLGQSVQAFVFKNGFEADCHVGNSLLDMYAKQGDMHSAEKIFEVLPVVNVVSWNVLISGYGQIGRGSKALETIELMKKSGFEPDEVTFISLLGACTKSGDVETACEMFCKIPNPSVFSWNALLSGYCQEEKYQKVIELFREMQNRCTAPDETTLAVILSSSSGLGNLRFGKEVHAASMKSMLHTNVFVSSGLVDMYAKCGQIELARRTFDRMPERDVVSWNSMITGFALHSSNKDAFSFFKLMQEDDMKPTEFSYASVINSCARLSAISEGKQIHAQITKNGHDADVYVGSALIDMYSKCGNVEEAERFFNCMPMRNIVSWNEMIHGYAQNGLGERAIALFMHMLSSKEKPNAVTFISVLTACSHSGLVDEGIEFLESMEKDHGIEPLAEHYTCVVDSLGRTGRLQEAEELVDRMKWRDDPIVWEVLLSSCAVHGDARLGRKAAEVLFRLDPNNSAPYVLLSNIYSRLGRWREASEVRALMSDCGVVKDRGYSWIDQKEGARAFMVDDDACAC